MAHAFSTQVRPATRHDSETVSFVLLSSFDHRFMQRAESRPRIRGAVLDAQRFMTSSKNPILADPWYTRRLAAAARFRPQRARHLEVALSPSFARLAQKPVERPKIVQPLRRHPLRHPSGNRDD
jgi:hypothetical protein